MTLNNQMIERRVSGESFTVDRATGDIVHQPIVGDVHNSGDMDASEGLLSASELTFHDGGDSSCCKDDSPSRPSSMKHKDLERAEQSPQNGLSNTEMLRETRSVVWAPEKDENIEHSGPLEVDDAPAERGMTRSSLTRSSSLGSTSSAIRSSSRKMESMEMAVQQANYLKRKRVFIASAAGLLAFNNGFLNGATLSGLASPGSKLPALTVTGLTASLSLNGLFLSQGLWENYGIHLGIILSYFSGCFIAGYTTPNPKPYRLEPTYGPTFILGGIFLMIGGLIASFLESYGVVAYWFSAAASGIQNGIASRYSSNLIRCTVTGTTTDIALIMAQMIRGVDANVDNGIVLAIITFSFWFGGALSFFAAERFLKYTLLANAVMFWIIGLGIIFFLVSELGLSVNAAVSGNWKWRKTMQSLRAMSGVQDMSLVDMFDMIDANRSGEVTPEELLDALLRAGVKTNLRTVRVLVNYADSNNNGTIDKEEWATIVEQVMEEASFTSRTVATASRTVANVQKAANTIRQESTRHLAAVPRQVSRIKVRRQPSGEIEIYREGEDDDDEEEESRNKTSPEQQRRT